MSFLEALQKKKSGLKSTETLIKTSTGDVFLEKRDEKGDCVMKKVAYGPGYVVDTKPDLQIAEVLPGLLMGSQDVAQSEEMVRAHNIKHILSVGVEVSQHIPGVKYTFVEALDLPEFDMKSVFDKCKRIINEDRMSGRVIYVHCNAGVSRSSSVVIAYLMIAEGIQYQEAYDRLKIIRPCIKPNDGFVKQLKLLNKNLFCS